MRSLIESFRKDGEVLDVKKEVSVTYEIPYYLKKNEEKIVFFENVKSYGIKVVGNICSTRERITKALNIEKNSLVEHLLNAFDSPKKVKIVKKGPIKDIVKEEVDIENLPILRHYEKDGGHFITAGIVVAKDPDTGVRNASIHRLMRLGKDKLGIRIVPRHLYKIFNENKKDGRSTEIAIIIGAHPALLLAASSSIPYEIDELEVANRLHEFKCIKCNTVDLEVPDQAEIVLEGRILNDKKHAEGPLVDITGTYDIVRDEPVVELTCLMHRKEPIYQAILPGGREHQLLMGLPQEPRILKAVRNITPNVKGIRLTEGGCHWFHAVISIEKQSEGDGKNVILAALSAHPSLKHVVVVDEDIDIFDDKMIEYAMATRVKGDEDIYIFPKIRGSSLDPTGDQVTSLVTKVGIDATKSFSIPPERFEIARIPWSED
ncbi:MAG: UbiD family decarboxylase [Candidatus Hydrothermarchaeota archaeon]